jgi:hypothetical protein
VGRVVADEAGVDFINQFRPEFMDKNQFGASKSG